MTTSTGAASAARGSRGINDTGCTYRISNDIYTALTLRLITRTARSFPQRAASAKPCTTLARSIPPSGYCPPMTRAAGGMIQTDAGRPLLCRHLLRQPLLTAAPYRAGCIFVGEEGYFESTISIYAMLLKDADGNSSRALRLPTATATPPGAERIYYLQPFVNNTDNSVSIFLLGLMTGPGNAPPRQPTPATSPLRTRRATSSTSSPPGAATTRAPGRWGGRCDSHHAQLPAALWRAATSPVPTRASSPPAARPPCRVYSTTTTASSARPPATPRGTTPSSASTHRGKVPSSWHATGCAITSRSATTT